MVLPDSLRFSAQSLCLVYFSVVATHDWIVWLTAVALVFLFASLRTWFESWWEVAYGAALGSVFALASVFVFRLQSFTATLQQPVERTTVHVTRFNRNVKYAIELILLTLVFSLIDVEITETGYAIGVTVTFVLLCVWFLVIGFMQRVDSIMYRTYFFLIISMFAIVLAHYKVYASIYAVSAVACGAALVMWIVVSLLWNKLN